jgi:hypothetical protein
LYENWPSCSFLRAATLLRKATVILFMSVPARRTT